jgi:quercetin dioxygenase-like cupin family protein
MQVTRLYTNQANVSAFEDLTLSLERVAVETFPGQKAEQFADLQAPSAMRVNETNAGHQYDWHNAPKRQFVVTLQGEIEVQLRDGTSRKFGPGSLLLAEDLTGTGHATKVISKDPWRCLYLPIDGRLPV